jgi:hypothetical protein
MQKIEPKGLFKKEDAALLMRHPLLFVSHQVSAREQSLETKRKSNLNDSSSYILQCVMVTPSLSNPKRAVPIVSLFFHSDDDLQSQLY